MMDGIIKWWAIWVFVFALLLGLAFGIEALLTWIATSGIDPQMVIATLALGGLSVLITLFIYTVYG